VRKGPQGETVGFPETGLPTTFEIVDVDISAAQLTPAAAMQIVSDYEWVRNLSSYALAQTRSNLVRMAAEMVVTDHTIRSTGREMVSKYAGKDALTGERFPAGTPIIYSRTGCLVA